MQCQKIEELLNDYLAGLLPAEVSLQVEDHLKICTACQSLFLVEDRELDVLLSSEWFAAEPDAGWTELAVNRILSRRCSWKRVALVALIWSSYITVWMLIAVQLWRPAILGRFLSGLTGVPRLLLTFGRAIRTVWQSMMLLQFHPVVCVMLVAVVIAALSGIRRLAREGLA